ncbi:MAG: hypothetical protein GY851_30155 [bacterium]|nr:hypothetical protein [bacterium]
MDHQSNERDIEFPVFAWEVGPGAARTPLRSLSWDMKIHYSLGGIKSDWEVTEALHEEIRAFDRRGWFVPVFARELRHVVVCGVEIEHTHELAVGDAESEGSEPDELRNLLVDCLAQPHIDLSIARDATLEEIVDTIIRRGVSTSCWRVPRASTDQNVEFPVFVFETMLRERKVKSKQSGLGMAALYSHQMINARLPAKDVREGCFRAFDRRGRWLSLEIHDRRRVQLLGFDLWHSYDVVARIDETVPSASDELGARLRDWLRMRRPDLVPSLDSALEEMVDIFIRKGLAANRWE